MSSFWDTHSVVDYPSKIIDMSYEAGASMTFVPIAADLVAPLESKAQRNGVSLETLVNMWLQEKLTVA